MDLAIESPLQEDQLGQAQIWACVERKSLEFRNHY